MDIEDDSVKAEASSTQACVYEENNLKFKDTLAETLNILFLNIAKVAKGEFQETSSCLQLIERMNERLTLEYNNQGDFASGLRIFVEKLKQKNDILSTYLKEIDEVDQEVTELEAVVSTLDNYTGNLEAKVMAIFRDRQT